MTTPILRSYSDTAPITATTAAVDASATTLPVSSTSGFPDPSVAPFTIGVDRGLSTQEAMLVTAATGSAFTVVRAFDGAAPQAHASGAPVQHAVVSVDFSDANSHIYDATRDDHSQYFTKTRIGPYLPQGLNISSVVTGGTAVTTTWMTVATINVTAAALPRVLRVDGYVVFKGGTAGASSFGDYQAQVFKDGSALPEAYGRWNVSYVGYFGIGSPNAAVVPIWLVSAWRALAPNTATSYSMMAKCSQSGSTVFSASMTGTAITDVGQL